MNFYKTGLMALILLLSLLPARAGDLPVVHITTEDDTPITSREEWRKNTLVCIVTPDGDTLYHSPNASVKSRGHSTFSKPKKPYTLKLEEASPLLGMQPHKRWVLLANFMDHSLLRNSLALAIARQTSLDWTPDSRLVDVVVNGRSQGCYLLCEAIRIDKHRVDIDEESGFLLEMDIYPDDAYRFETKHRHLPVNVAYPKEPTDEQKKYIADYLNKIEELLYNGSANLDVLYRDYLDMDSFVDWWLIHELTQNAEPNGPRSCYMYKDKDGLLKAGPVWDFDLAFISVGLDKGGDLRPSRLNRTDVIRLNGDSLYNRKALWYDRLLQDPTFVHRIQARWKQLAPGFRALVDQLDAWQTLIEPSALADEALWKGQDPARFDIFTEWRSSVANLKKVYAYRIERLNQWFTSQE